jgi:hypothetical protein
MLYTHLCYQSLSIPLQRIILLGNVMNFIRLSTISACVGALVVCTGCATNSELAKVQTEAREARQTADQALSLAQEANQRSERTQEMVSRSFKHSMKK